MVIDSTIFIEHLRAPDKKKTTLSQIAGNDVLYLSAVTLYELYIGAPSGEKQNDIKLLTEGLIVLPFTDGIAVHAATIYRNLKKLNQLIEFRDIFIAATCVINNMPLKTLNKKHFDRIQGLMVL